METKSIEPAAESPRSTRNTLPFGTIRPAPVAREEPRHEAPPAKKRRVECEPTRPKSLEDCLRQYVVPHAIDATHMLPGNPDRDDEGVAFEMVLDIAKSAWFRERYHETKGYLMDMDVVQVKAALARISNDQAFLARNIATSLEPRRSSKVEIAAAASRSDSAPQIRTKKSSRQPPPTPAAQPTKPPTQIAKPPNLNSRPISLRLKRREPKPNNRWFQVSQQRPYRTAADRKAIAQGAKQLVRAPSGVASKPTVYHVDFTGDEVAQITRCISSYVGNVPATLDTLASLCQNLNIPTLVGTRVKGRSVEDIRNFCSDLMAGQASPLEDLRVLSLHQEIDDDGGDAFRASRISQLLFAREIEANVGFGGMRTYENFQNEFKKAHEDGLQVVAEFTNCAGDITTGTWVSSTNFLCGTTAHSDAHNQQYNKPGNLLLCSTTAGTLRSFADHRIPRPRVEKGENSTEAMRQSQDPWLYSSVVSSDYDQTHDLAYTSSFDKTVKVWKVDRQGQSMKSLATWQHTANVNFVAASKDGAGRVATAADAPTDAVRIYTISPSDPGNFTYQSFSCSRTDANNTDKWAYYPSTMQWGRAEGTHHLLLVGYSPRSTSGDDADVPEDKWHSGEIVLWDAEQGSRLPIVTASTANVFEVLWHPTLPRFIVATTPTGLKVEAGVRTQIHVFQWDRERLDGGYGQFQALDCFASDINEITLMPNSVRHAYVTAACTDGKVYVWDTAQGDEPIHILKHGSPLEEPLGDREKEDTGVKFTAWGSTPDRFYTGSSDGVVKVWNVRNHRKPWVRNLLEAPGPISFGAFSPDQSKLAIGDATGRVYILSVYREDEPESHFITLPGSNHRVRRPRPLIPHPEPPAPGADDAPTDGDSGDELDTDIATYSRRTYLDSRQLTLSKNPVIGAVQGPCYSSTNLVCKDAHLNEDPTLPLLAEFERHQKENEVPSHDGRRRSVRRLRHPAPPDVRLEAMHAVNRARDLDLGGLDAETVRELVREGALVDVDEDWGFEYEEMPAEF